MTTTTAHTQTGAGHTGRSLLLGIGLWFLHLNISYGLASVSCKWGWFSSHIGGLSALQLVEAVITLVAALLMLVLIYLPWRTWRSFQTDRPTDNPHLLQDTEKDRRPLAAFIVMLLNSLFLLFMLGLFVPLFALNACAQG